MSARSGQRAGPGVPPPGAGDGPGRRFGPSFGPGLGGWQRPPRRRRGRGVWLALAVLMAAWVVGGWFHPGIVLLVLGLVLIGVPLLALVVGAAALWWIGRRALRSGAWGAAAPLLTQPGPGRRAWRGGVARLSRVTWLGRAAVGARAGGRLALRPLRRYQRAWRRHRAQPSAQHHDLPYRNLRYHDPDSQPGERARNGTSR